MMKFAINSHLPGLTIEQEAPVLQQHGYTGWEHWLPTVGLRKGTTTFAQLRDQARYLKKLGDDHGIATIAVGVGLTPRHIVADIGYVRQVFELVREAGSTGVRMSGIHYNDPAPPPSQAANMDDVSFSYHERCARFHELFAESRELMARLSDEATRAGVQLLLEIHPFYIHNSPSAMLRLIEHCAPGAVGVLLDPQGMAMQGHEGSKQSVDVLRHYLAHMHVKDSLLVRTETGKLRHQQCALWEGTTQWPLLVAALKWVGFDGYWFDEDFRGVGIEARLETKTYLEKLWAEAPTEPSVEMCREAYLNHYC
jgi:sugar phosphate isomerase/epimerase